MSNVRFLYEPLDDGPGGADIPTSPTITSDFDTKWSKTLDDLDREIYALGGRSAVIEVDCRRRDIRQDGQMRADTKLASGRVRVSFESRHGPMSLSSGRFVRRPNTAPDWQHNLRAIALSLESLRRVERYGVVQGSQRYTEFLAIAAGPADPPTGGWDLTGYDGARAWLRQLTGHDRVGAALRDARRRALDDLDVAAQLAVVEATLTGAGAAGDES